MRSCGLSFMSGRKVLIEYHRPGYCALKRLETNMLQIMKAGLCTAKYFNTHDALLDFNLSPFKRRPRAACWLFCHRLFQGSYVRFWPKLLRCPSWLVIFHSFCNDSIAPELCRSKILLDKHKGQLPPSLLDPLRFIIRSNSE